MLPTKTQSHPVSGGRPFGFGGLSLTEHQHCSAAPTQTKPRCNYFNLTKSHVTGQFPICGSWIPVFPKTGHRHCIHGDTLDGEEEDSQECRSTSDNTAHPAAKPSSKLFLRTSENPRGRPPLSAIPRCAAASGSPSAGSALQEDGKMEGRGHAAPWKSRACCAVFSTSCPWKPSEERRG